MATRTFNARWVESVKPTPGERVEYNDQKTKGLTLRITENGVKTYVLRYRHRGRSMKMTLGRTDVVPLADARERARTLLNDVSEGADPSTDKQQGRRAKTIQDMADLFIELHAKPNKRSWKADDNLLRKKVLPRWRHRAIVDIKRADVLDLVQAVADDGAPIVANRVAALLSKMFAWALNTLFDEQRKPLLEISPATKIPRRRESPRDRVLADAELRKLWASFDALEPTMAAFFKLRLLTAQRGGEVSDMRWADVDLESGWWVIPATRSKNRLAHRVPLNAPAVKLLTTLRTAAAKDAVYVLGAATRAKGEGARGKRQQSEATATFNVADFRGHDLRRTAASIMASGGIPRLVISKVLNHVERGVTSIYDRHSYDGEKAAAMTWWATKLTAILENERSTVLPFARSTDVA